MYLYIGYVNGLQISLKAKEVAVATPRIGDVRRTKMR